MNKPFSIEKAKPEDLEAILEVMRPWNMHHVPSPEVEELDLSCFFVARVGEKTVGAAGYKLLSQSRAKTTLMAVLPEYGRSGIGKALQDARLEAMAAVGVKSVITNADRPATIKWYIKCYGYREVGCLKKLHSFGDPAIEYWTTLELDLEAFLRKRDLETGRQDYIARNEPHPLAPYPPLLINACLVGMVPTKKQTPFLPITPEEIIEDAIKVSDLGAQIVHIHARDADGHPTWKASVFEKILTGIRRERPELICCVTTSGRIWSDFERRTEVLHLTGMAKPDFASLALGSMNFPAGPSVNTPEMIERLAQTMKEKGIRPELEVFDLGMIGSAKYLERKGLIGGRKYFNLLFGNLGTMPATIGNLSTMVAALPSDSAWAAAGIDMFQLPMNVAAIVAGGGVRIGIEDAVYYDYSKTQPASNEQLVRRIVRIAEECQRPVATAAQARKMLGME